MKQLSNMRKTRLIILLIATVATGMVNAQVKVTPKIKPEEVPPEVQKVIDETMSGQHALYDFERYKVDLGFDSTTKLSDLRVGKPFKDYRLATDSIRTLDERKFDENIPVSAIVAPCRTWLVPVFLNDRCVRIFGVSKTNRKPEWHFSFSYGCYPEWQKVIEAWPDSAGYHPIIIHEGLLIPRFFHVPEKDDFNLTPLMRRAFDPLDQSADTSYRVLMSSNRVLKHVKKSLPPKRDGGTR